MNHTVRTLPTLLPSTALADQTPSPPPTHSPLPRLSLHPHRIPRTLRPKRLPPDRSHNLPLHDLDVSLDGQLVLAQAAEAAAVKEEPGADYEARQGDC